jgi:hypothetical protein
MWDIHKACSVSGPFIKKFLPRKRGYVRHPPYPVSGAYQIRIRVGYVSEGIIFIQIRPKDEEEGFQAVDDKEEQPQRGSGAAGGVAVAHVAGAAVLPFLSSRRRGRRCPCRLGRRAALPQLPSLSPAPLGHPSRCLDAPLCCPPRRSTDPTKEPTPPPLLGAAGHRCGGVGGGVVGRGRSQIRRGFEELR